MLCCSAKAWPYIVTVPPASLPLTLTEVKTHLRIDLADNSEDTYLTALIKTVTNYAEKFTKRDFITRTYATYRDSFCDSLEIRRSLLQSITSVEYLKDDVLTLVSTDIYFATQSTTFSTLRLKENQLWPTDLDNQDQAVKIIFTAGYGNDSDVPEDLKTAMLNHIASLYENRGDCDDRVSGSTFSSAQAFLPVDTHLIYSMNAILTL